MQFDAQHGNTAAIFGKGCVEARLPEAIRTVASDAKGVLVVCSPRGQQVLGPVVKALPLAATFCTEVVQHVPQPVIDQVGRLPLLPEPKSSIPLPMQWCNKSGNSVHSTHVVDLRVPPSAGCDARKRR